MRCGRRGCRDKRDLSNRLTARDYMRKGYFAIHVSSLTPCSDARFGLVGVQRSLDRSGRVQHRERKRRGNCSFVLMRSHAASTARLRMTSDCWERLRFLVADLCTWS